MAAPLADLLSSLPPLPLPTTKAPPPPPSLPFPWKRLPRIKADGFLPSPVTTSPLVQSSAGVILPTKKEEIICSCFPSLAWANVFYAKGGYYNAQVVVGEDEPEEVLLRRFKREVMKAGVIQECKRRRWFENMQEKRKRKAREATRRNRKRRYQPIVHKQDKQEEPKEKKQQEEEEDNWGLPEGEIPYCVRMP